MCVQPNDKFISKTRTFIAQQTRSYVANRTPARLSGADPSNCITSRPCPHTVALHSGGISSGQAAALRVVFQGEWIMPEKASGVGSDTSSPKFQREQKTVWPSGLRRWLQAPVRKGVGSNPTAVISFHQLEQLDFVQPVSDCAGIDPGTNGSRGNVPWMPICWLLCALSSGT
jgi:hypothetical protein